MKKFIDENELRERIALNYNRLSESSYYKAEEIFSPADYDWQGDKEGRALLAFVSHYKISGKKIPCMTHMLKKLPEKLNSRGYLGAVSADTVSEQQLSGHSWLLRGLCEYYERFSDDYALTVIKSIVENLYLPTKGLYYDYPANRAEANVGDVSGSETGRLGKWLLSSDIGCAFMSIDGLSHAYKVTCDERIKELLDEEIKVFLSIDKVALRAQTHCTLTAARGLLRMYSLLSDEKYLKGAREIYDLYFNGGGVTYTYQNLNWWHRPDSWTEPCAVIDSLMLALELYKLTGDETFRKTAARVYHNGFATLQRDNGGTDTVVTAESGFDRLQMQTYEAPFCCSMRLAEGLWYVNENKALLYAETTGRVTKNQNGVYSDGDIIYALPDKALYAYAESFTETDGMKLSPIVKYYRVPENIIETAGQKIIFK